MIKPRLKEYIRVLNIELEAEELKMTLGLSPTTMTMLEGDYEILGLLKLCDGLNDTSEIVKQMKINYATKEEDTLEALNYLENENLTEEAFVTSHELSIKELDRYNRHFVYYSTFPNVENKYLPQEKLKKATVALIGMGGIGNWTSLSLASSGIGTIIGIDPDTIELSNLTRQILFTESDVGKKKVIQAKKRLEMLNSDINFIPIDKEMISVESVKETIKGADIVVLSADKPEHIQYWVDKACYELKIPYINVGYQDHWGVCGPLTIPDKTSCLICDVGSEKVNEDKLNKIEEVVEINSRAKAASFGPLNGLMSCIGSMEVIKYLTDYQTPLTIGKRLMVHSGTFETIEIEYPQKSDCVQCGV